MHPLLIAVILPGSDVQDHHDVNDGGSAGSEREREVELVEGEDRPDDKVLEGAQDSEQELSGDHC